MDTLSLSPEQQRQDIEASPMAPDEALTVFRALLTACNVVPEEEKGMYEAVLPAAREVRQDAIAASMSGSSASPPAALPKPGILQNKDIKPHDTDPNLDTGMIAAIQEAAGNRNEELELSPKELRRAVVTTGREINQYIEELRLAEELTVGYRAAREKPRTLPNDQLPIVAAALSLYASSATPFAAAEVRYLAEHHHEFGIDPRNI